MRNSLIATRPEPQPNPTLCIDLLYTGTRMRPSSYAKLIQPTTQPKQTNPQPNPNTTRLRFIIVHIYRAAQEIRPSSRSREIGILKQLLRSYQGPFILCFC